MTIRAYCCATTVSGKPCLRLVKWWGDHCWFHQ